MVENKLHNLADLLTELREKTGKEWTLWDINFDKLNSMYHRKVLVGYLIPLENEKGFTVESWEIWFGQVENFLKKQLEKNMEEF